ncbi:MAG TPA: hypothetical protein VHO47_04435 [Candidatus Babeliales bacterium]|nr:hypothetical protein [Candidatus Babeliales bacterium]
MKKLAQLLFVLSSVSAISFGGDSIIVEESTAASPTKKISTKPIIKEEAKKVASPQKKTTSPASETIEKKSCTKDAAKKPAGNTPNKDNKAPEKKKSGYVNPYAIKKETGQPEPIVVEKPIAAPVIMSEQKKEPVIAQKEKKGRTVQIKNSITKDMITYHHWTGKHTPDFVLKINGNEVKQGVTASVPVENNAVKFEYIFNFANGYYKDTKKAEFTLPAGDAFELDFSWKSQPNIKIIPAK